MFKQCIFFKLVQCQYTFSIVFLFLFFVIINNDTKNKRKKIDVKFI